MVSGLTQLIPSTLRATNGCGDVGGMGCWEFVLTWGPLNHQKQTWGLKFNTLGGSRDDEDDDHLYKGWQF